MSGVAAVGWHGKLPALGDFAQRRLDPQFIRIWDHWLSQGLVGLHQREGWLDAYLASPSWRFLLMPGVLPDALGHQAWAGVLMPSVDRVGRYYPLTLAQPLPGWPADAQSIEALWTWLVRLDETAADALHDDWTIEQLEAELSRMPMPDFATAPPVVLPDNLAPLQTVGLAGFPHPGALMQAQATAAWQRQVHGTAFWFAHTDSQVPRLLAVTGPGSTSAGTQASWRRHRYCGVISQCDEPAATRR